jgi:hypothetical protein
MRPAHLTAVALLAATGFLAHPAQAKQGVRAKLLAPVDMEARAGTLMRVRFKLVDPSGRPFSASDIYLRVSRCGRGPLRITAKHSSINGRFSARFRVPRGGVRKLMVGLEGIRIIGDEQTRADRFFQFDPVLYSRRGCP